MPIIERIQLPPADSRLKERWWGCLGLEAMYLMNQGAGTRLFDHGPYRRDGMIYGATWGAQGLGFAGAQYVTEPDAASLSANGFTITALANATAGISARQYLWGEGQSGGYRMRFGYGSATSVGMFVANDGGTTRSCTASRTEDSKWFVLSGVMGADTVVRAYLDGRAIGTPSAAVGTVATLSAGSVKLGAYAVGHGRWIGMIALVAIHSRALSDAENAQFYRELINGFEMFETPSQAYRRRLLA